ncbi:curli-like amyloid fiber formation chaperone CsgH [Halomonas sp. M20]|uniref:curli-like amyloid fiber formation chaperone CsgH n=1 Tax=Halomonas sp. M20 TaxID=2763264 RepID=UPI001D0B4793|nr:curli-like amyloid fiber formation chaperone CsgH [Halomonas sp. M20]
MWARILSILLPFGLLAMMHTPLAIGQQAFTQLDCRIVIERKNGSVSAAAIIQASQPTRADYQLRTLKIDATGSGTFEQSGSYNLEPGETIETSRITSKIAPDGWIEFYLNVSERLTGTSCQAKEIVSPM